MPAAPDPSPYPIDHLALRGEDDDRALVLRDESLSWNGLRSRVAQLAGWLAEQLPQKGARVATWASKGELTCIMPLAAARAGLVHVPINPLLKRAQVKHILEDSGDWGRLPPASSYRRKFFHMLPSPPHRICRIVKPAPFWLCA